MMKRSKVFVVLLTSLVFLGSPVLATLTPAATITLPGDSSNEALEVTKAQLTSLKAQPGIQFVETLPAELPAGQIAVELPAELGGGYILGTAEAIASAFNAAGITVGLTAIPVAGATTLTKAGLLVATMGGIIAAVLSSGKDGAAAHHSATHH